MIDAVMYGMMPEREHRDPLQAAAGEGVDEAEEGALRRLHELEQRLRIDARRRDVQPIR